MTIRKTARWRQCLDDRILEQLRDQLISTAKQIAIRDGIHATESQVQDRCKVLADADLVGFLTEDRDFVEVTTEGEQYLEGEVDVELFRIRGIRKRWSSFSPLYASSVFELGIGSFVV